ncbi:MAG: HAMP domain-containing histidine kinase [Fibrobacter sp.]|nr:HAMP domain-containing histidine kinase [Fibrobacter sp.]
MLSVLSFRSIQNELYLAKKNFEENVISFQNELETAITREQNKILQETKAVSQTLYEQPPDLRENENSTPIKNVDGIRAIFLFNQGNRIYPSLPLGTVHPENNFSTQEASPVEVRIFQEEQSNPHSPPAKTIRNIRRGQMPSITDEEQIQNLLGLVRTRYHEENYNEVFQLLDDLEAFPHAQSYLLSNLLPALKLMRFEVLVKQKKLKEAEHYTLFVLKGFLTSQEFETIESARFFFEKTFNTILSFENLPADSRELFWNLRENLNRQLFHADVLIRHEIFFSHLIQDNASPKDGIFYKQDGANHFFRMSYPWLSGDQVVIGMIEPEQYKKRLLKQVQTVVRGWKNIPYVITDVSDSLISGKYPEDLSSDVAVQKTLGLDLNWTLTLYKRNSSEMLRATRYKMFLLYSLSALSLITVLLGSFFAFRALTQEQKLLSMKANFLSSVSHELKTPLTSIKMFAEMMARGRVQKTEKIQEYSELIGKESTRLENLIAAILNYTRMEHGKSAFRWERFDLAVCVEKFLESTQELMKSKDLAFNIKIQPHCFIIGDYTAIYSLVQNLVENAIKYTNPPGKIDIILEEDEHKIIFSVIDTGIGIPVSEQKNIFNDFYRVGDEMTRSTKGSGLGLAIVKRVADTHRASISLQSRPGKGSNFTVRFKKAE